MSQRSLADGVQFERVSTPRELESSLATLPDGVRFGIACDLNERGRALRLDQQTQRVIDLRLDGDDIVIVTCGPMSTLFEAAILMSGLKTLDRPLDEAVAVQLYRKATFRPEIRVEPRKLPPPSPPVPGLAERLRAAMDSASRRWRSLRPRFSIQASRT